MAYHQYCSMARSLDVVGDRWTLLIVRELLARPARFTDLKAGLPGIAPNLLSLRLKALQADGVIERRLSGSAVEYTLTEWGAGLRAPLEALARWGAPLMRKGPGDDSFRPHWLVPALSALLGGGRAAERTSVGIRVDGVTLGVTRGPAGTSVDLEPSGPFDAELEASAQTLLALASGAMSIADAEHAGAVISGSRDGLERVLAGSGTAAGAA